MTRSVLSEQILNGTFNTGIVDGHLVAKLFVGAFNAFTKLFVGAFNAFTKLFVRAFNAFSKLFVGAFDGSHDGIKPSVGQRGGRMVRFSKAVILFVVFVRSRRRSEACGAEATAANAGGRHTKNARGQDAQARPSGSDAKETDARVIGQHGAE